MLREKKRKLRVSHGGKASVNSVFSGSAPTAQ